MTRTKRTRTRYSFPGSTPARGYMAAGAAGDSGCPTLGRTNPEIIPYPETQTPKINDC